MSRTVSAVATFLGRAVKALPLELRQFCSDAMIAEAQAVACRKGVRIRGHHGPDWRPNDSDEKVPLRALRPDRKTTPTEPLPAGN